MKPSVPYRDILMRELQDPKACLGYLQAAVEDPDPRVFLVALSDVARVQQGISKLSQTVQMSREHLYDLLSRKGNPGYLSLRAILQALGFEFSIQSKTRKERRKAA